MSDGGKVLGRGTLISLDGEELCVLKAHEVCLTVYSGISGEPFYSIPYSNIEGAYVDFEFSGIGRQLANVAVNLATAFTASLFRQGEQRYFLIIKWEDPEVQRRVNTTIAMKKRVAERVGKKVMIHRDTFMRQLSRGK